ncbi:MAG TPA: hypothetical protein VFS95_12160 [Telluria sp.]|jgi:hypothetical protein|nr:hypothetical protein [Telluria sp.]
MRIDYLSSDILLFRGDSLAALATAFIDGERVLLVDALASQFDAIDMRDYLQDTLGKRVEQIVLLDAGGAHPAALALFPGAHLTDAASAPASIAWGRHTLELHAGAAGLHIDVPDADLLLVGASIVGNIARLGSATPEQADQTLLQLLDRGRTRVVPRTMGATCNRALGNARAYLAQLRASVIALRRTLAPDEADRAIAGITLDACMAKGEWATPLERHWHGENLRQIVASGAFAAHAVERRRAPRTRTQACRDTVVSVLTAMLGRLVERGV